MKQLTQRLWLVHIEQRSYSVRGTPRWMFTAWTDEGLMLTFKTASTAGSAYDCNLNRLKSGDPIWVTYHQTGSGMLVADSWDDGRVMGDHCQRAVAEQTNGGQHG